MRAESRSAALGNLTGRDCHEDTYQHTDGFEKKAAGNGHEVIETGPVGFCSGNGIDLDGVRRWERRGSFSTSTTGYGHRFRCADRVPGCWAKHRLDSEH